MHISIMKVKYWNLIQGFNNTGTLESIIFLFTEDCDNIRRLVQFANKNINLKKLCKLKFSVLKLTPDFIIYINGFGEIIYSNIKVYSLRLILSDIKNYLKDSHSAVIPTEDIGIALLIAGKGNIKSYDVFTNINTENFANHDIKLQIVDKKNWLRNRSKLHEKIVRQCLKEVRLLSKFIYRSKKMEKALYCMRGSVASGKSTFAKKFLKDSLPTLKGTSGIINTDFVKQLLVKNTKNLYGGNLPGYVFHDEASMLSKIILEHAKKEKLLYFIDKRMQDDGDFSPLLIDAKDRKLPVVIFDIEVDFVTSALRVLRRTGIYPSDPTPDFKSLLKSYKNIEEGRKSFMREAMVSPVVKNYYSVAYTNSGKPTLTALKNNFKIVGDHIKKLINYESFENTVLVSGKSLKESLDDHSKKPYEDKKSKKDYLIQVLDNIKNTSRTFNGELNTSASPDKKNKMKNNLSTEEIKQCGQNNIESAFGFIYSNKNIAINDPLILYKFINKVAIIINSGLIVGEEHLIRKGVNSQKYNYVNIKYVESFYRNFVKNLYLKLNDIDLDPIETAAWIEWNIDFCGHIFSDGCGRIAKVISSWSLIRRGWQLPDYSQGLDGFTSIRSSYRKRFTIRERIDFKVPTNDDNYIEFLNYYKRLFTNYPVWEKVLASGGLVYNSAGQFLILQTTKGKDSGKWVLPGGKLEKNENPNDAFKREVFEETGLNVKGVKLLGSRDYAAVSGNLYYFYDYTSDALDELNVQINNESSSYVWISKKQVNDYVFTDSIKNFLGKYFIANMSDYYKEVEEINLKHLDKPDFNQHTMFTSLESYIGKKLPVAELEEYLSSIKRFEIRGIYPDLRIISELELDFQIIKVISESDSKKNNSNSLRPIFILAERNSEIFIVCCVTPGRDLLLHYASMVNFFLKENKTIKLSVYAYPVAEKNIGEWTGLDETMVHANDIVILGYSTFSKVMFSKDSLFSVVTLNQNKFYTSTRFLTHFGKVVNCLEANYGHWGDISDYLSYKICQLGSLEIIHIGKVGTFTSPSEVYKRIYIPSKFVIGRRSKILDNSVGVKNSLEYIKEHSSLVHASVSTTMEETFAQRDHFSKHQVETIDIESSKIAQAVALHNSKSAKKVKFGAIHFSSDYLRKSGEVDKDIEFDLSNERIPQVQNKKNKILNEIFETIKKHIINS